MTTPARRNQGTPTDRPSPLQNRVLPTGAIVADPARGMLMGNRGSIHRLDRTLGVTRWRSKMWICCVLRWGDTRRDVMPPGRWTALFFLDEVTALAAGHRPCGYCRRPDHLAFGQAWREAQQLAGRPLAAEMDIELHAERVQRSTRSQVTRQTPLAGLPDGAMVRHQGGPALLSRGSLLPWSLDGYGAPQPLPDVELIELLTPPKIIGVLANGYVPMAHPSAGVTSLRTVDG